MSGPEQGTTPTPETPPSAWVSPPPDTSKDAGPAPGVTYADLGIRIGAYIIEAIIFGVALGIFAAIVLGALALGAGFAGVVVGIILLVVFNLVFSAIYFIYTWTRMRASPGQRVLGLETVNAADGATITQQQAINRWLVLFGPTALLSAVQWVAGSTLGTLAGLVSLGYVIYLAYTTNKDPKRQGFHDHYANTVVVKRSA
jgi:uncharacterized RDD family membrane protein YckC